MIVAEETMTITLTIPKSMAPMIEAARREIDATHGRMLDREELCLHLIERGARSVDAYRSSADFRSLASISVGELVDLLGISDIEGARRAAREAHERHHAVIQESVALFKDVAGLRQICTKQRITTAKDLADLAVRVGESMKEHPTLAVVLALAYVDTSKGAPEYTPIVLPEHVN